MRRAVAGNGDQYVELHAMARQQAQAAHHLFMAGAALLVRPVRVVDGLRAVQRQPHREAVLRQEDAPFVVEQGAVGLQAVADGLALAVFLLQRQRAAEEIQSQQSRFAALPGELHFRRVLRRDVALHVGPQHLVGHAEFFARRIQLLLLQVEAVVAIEVAQRPDRLGHQVQALFRRGRGHGGGRYVHGEDSQVGGRSRIVGRAPLRRLSFFDKPLSFADTTHYDGIRAASICRRRHARGQHEHVRAVRPGTLFRDADGLPGESRHALPRRPQRGPDTYPERSAGPAHHQPGRHPGA